MAKQVKLMTNKRKFTKRKNRMLRIIQAEIDEQIQPRETIRKRIKIAVSDTGNSAPMILPDLTNPAIRERLEHIAAEAEEESLRKSRTTREVFLSGVPRPYGIQTKTGGNGK